MTDHVTPNKARELAGTLDLTQYAEHSDALMSLASQVEELIKSEAELCENTVTLQNDLVDAEAQVEQYRAVVEAARLVFYDVIGVGTEQLLADLKAEVDALDASRSESDA